MRKYLSEFIGTAVLVLVGCGSAVAANTLFSAMGMGLPIAFTTLLIAVSFGVAYITMYYSVGTVSGCHLNPAVSLAMLIAKKLSVKDFAGYVVSQLLGSVAGAGILAALIQGTSTLNANGYDSQSTFGISMVVALVIEIIMTFIFVMSFMGATEREDNKGIAGIAIGFATILVYIFSAPFTGGSANPARSFGPAVIQQGDALTQLWVFIVGPLVGAALAAFVYIFLHAEPKKKPQLPEPVLENEEAEAVEAVEADEVVEADEETEVVEIVETVEVAEEQ